MAFNMHEFTEVHALSTELQFGGRALDLVQKGGLVSLSSTYSPLQQVSVLFFCLGKRDSVRSKQNLFSTGLEQLVTRLHEIRPCELKCRRISGSN
jgi:hypothetical protein